MRVFFLVLLSTVLVIPSIALGDSVVIATTPYAYDAYKAFLESQQKSPYEIVDFDFPQSNRVVVDLILIMQALRLGGCRKDVEFVLSQNYARNINEVKDGIIPILGQETWAEEFDDSVYQSQAIIRRGEFKKALVGREGEQQLLLAIERADFSQLSAVTGLGWTVDIRTLHAMKVGRVVTSPKFALQEKMILAGRVDFGLYEYKDIGTGKVELPEGLIAIPNVMVGLEGSRHFMVSKRHPDGQELFEALERGLNVLRSRGSIYRALVQCGFIPSKDAGMKQIYP